MPAPSRADLRRVASRAWRAAARARWALRPFLTILLASVGCSSNQSASCSLVARWTSGLDLGVAELGLGLALELRLAEAHGDDGGEALADVLARRLASFSLSRPLARAYLLITVVRAARKPSSWVPPSMVAMPLAKLCSPSVW